MGLDSGGFMKKDMWLAIGVGGLTAGTIDLLQASILFGWDIPLTIADGLLEPRGVSRRLHFLRNIFCESISLPFARRAVGRI